MRTTETWTELQTKRPNKNKTRVQAEDGHSIEYVHLLCIFVKFRSHRLTLFKILYSKLRKYECFLMATLDTVELGNTIKIMYLFIYLEFC